MRKTIPKQDSAVSPIIGTVLLVAITVTLVASAYTVLGGYFSNLPAAGPTASLNVVNGTSVSGTHANGTYTLSVTSLSNNVTLDRVEIQVSLNNSEIYTALAPELTGPTPFVLFSSNSTNITVSYSGPAGYLTPSSSFSITETNTTSFVSMISLIDTQTDSSMGYVSIVA